MRRHHPRIGVLALQGSFAEHVESLRKVGADSFEVRTPEELERADGLVLPGGESTTILKLMDLYGLREPLQRRVRAGLPVLGTCAGVVCLCMRIATHAMDPLCLIDIEVERNAFGRQVDSFEEDLEIEGIEGPPFRGVFIRAPIIKTCGPEARVVARLGNGTIVACAQDNVLVTSFHPEFVDDLRVHRYFTDMVESVRSRSSAKATAQSFSHS